jgi:hypothetical protein
MSIYSKLHEQLSIPRDYHLADMPEPRLPLDKRRDAIVKLVSSGEIKEDSADELIDALCRKLGRFIFVRDKRKASVPHNPWTPKKQSSLLKGQQIMAALIANPKASSFVIANELDVGETTVRRYRSKLKAEGKL